jgi:hypothetical protein
MGFNEDQIEVHQEATNLYGYKGDKRQDKANIIVRRKYVGRSSNDIGWERQEDGTYKAIISKFDSSKYNKDWNDKLTMNYSIEQAKESFNQHGWNYTESVNADGDFQLVGRHF